MLASADEKNGREAILCLDEEGRGESLLDGGFVVVEYEHPAAILSCSGIRGSSDGIAVVGSLIGVGRLTLTTS